MTKQQSSVLERLLHTITRQDAAPCLLNWVQVPAAFLFNDGNRVSRAELASALTLRLYADLLDRVSSARDYVLDATKVGRKLVFDHGALRTVALEGMGRMPAGQKAITRVLGPLGYKLRETYRLDRIGMTGYSYAHDDLPEELPQFFVSELHPEQFSVQFQTAVFRVTESSQDPLPCDSQQLLAELDSAGYLSFEQAEAILPSLVACFQRQHRIPYLADYQTLLTESAEMAWIATEGNAFNHATNRVFDLQSLVIEQRSLGRPIKQDIEISRSGRIWQTAFKADLVKRAFIEKDETLVYRLVPGSFYEFIQRDRLLDPNTGLYRLDLSFDSSNAQSIFKMTAAA